MGSEPRQLVGVGEGRIGMALFSGGVVVWIVWNDRRSALASEGRKSVEVAEAVAVIAVRRSRHHG